MVRTSRALTDLEKTIDYLITNFSVQEVINLERDIQDTITVIDNNPNVFPKSKKKLVRKAVVLKFNNLMYSNSEDEIIILSFFSNRQNPGKHKL